MAWLAPTVGFPPDVAVKAIETDLSTLQVTADIVFELLPPHRGYLHLEPQSSWDGEFFRRLQCYNSVIRLKKGPPVYTIALLLRPEANTSELTGVYRETNPLGVETFHFTYGVIRCWELSADDLLKGPLGAIPLVVLTNDARPRIPELIARVDQHITAEGVNNATRDVLLLSCYLLLGLRYNEEEATLAFSRVSTMRESTTYQKIMREGFEIGREEGRKSGREEGREIGREEALQQTLLEILRERFGSVPEPVEQTILALHNEQRLRAIIRQSIRATSLDELQL
jgi:hypothetical protein